SLPAPLSPPPRPTRRSSDLLTNLVAGLAAGDWINISANMIAHVPLMIYGALIIGFLLFEPLGLAKIYDNLRKYFLVWSFRHSRRSEEHTSELQSRENLVCRL